MNNKLYETCAEVMRDELGTCAGNENDVKRMIEWFYNACRNSSIDPTDDVTGRTICRAIRNAYLLH